ncbi:hypothetical protein A9993_05080 [Rahnella victoriana]|jgi:hypothetical protein|nr:hypothetical protein A9993_05080 [Rahnella victoriana]
MLIRLLILCHKFRREIRERLIECHDGAISIIYRRKISGNNANSLSAKGLFRDFHPLAKQRVVIIKPDGGRKDRFRLNLTQLVTEPFHYEMVSKRLRVFLQGVLVHPMPQIFIP